MNKCFQETDMLEWMPKGKTIPSKKRSQKRSALTTADP